MKKLYRFIVILALFFGLVSQTFATTETFTSSTTWTAPAGVTSVTAEVWGAGGSGASYLNVSNGGASGGGGGAYSKKLNISVTPGNSYTVTVGVGGTAVTQGSNGNVGGDSWFSSTGTVLAKGGSGGLQQATGDSTGRQGGQASSGVGDTKYNGGNSGSTGISFSSSGGGSGAGDSQNGNNGTNSSNSTYSAGGAAATNNGGKGGDATGGNSSVTYYAQGGASYGGGGGGVVTGTNANQGVSGAGYNGAVVLTYTAVVGPTRSRFIGFGIQR